MPIGYATPELFDVSQVRGGTPYGATTIAGADGSRQPSNEELTIARYQGEHVAKITAKLKVKHPPAPVIQRFAHSHGPILLPTRRKVRMPLPGHSASEGGANSFCPSLVSLRREDGRSILRTAKGISQCLKILMN